MIYYNIFNTFYIIQMYYIYLYFVIYTYVLYIHIFIVLYYIILYYIILYFIIYYIILHTYIIDLTCPHMFRHTCMHACILTYLFTYWLTDWLTYLLTYIHTHIRIFLIYSNYPTSRSHHGRRSRPWSKPATRQAQRHWKKRRRRRQRRPRPRRSWTWKIWMFLGRMLWGNGWWLVGEWLGMIKHDITIVNGGYSYSWVIDGVVHGWLMCICFQRNHAFKNTNNMWWLKDKFTMNKWFEVANPSLTTLVGVTVLHVFRKKTYIYI